MSGDTSKATLRRHALARRDLISPTEAHAAAEAATERGTALVRTLLPDGACISAYWPMRGELSPRPLLERLGAAGFRTALPVAGQHREALTFRLWSTGDDLQRGILGTSQPTAEAASAAPALLFVPLLAFDAGGMRLGYGAGHYDATLAALRASGRVFAVGLAFDAQEIAAVPAEPHDQRLDYIVTESRTLRPTQS